MILIFEVVERRWPVGRALKVVLQEAYRQPIQGVFSN
jgi:hypothetical protein